MIVTISGSVVLVAHTCSYCRPCCSFLLFALTPSPASPLAALALSVVTRDPRPVLNMLNTYGLTQTCSAPIWQPIRHILDLKLRKGYFLLIRIAANIAMTELNSTKLGYVDQWR